MILYIDWLAYVKLFLHPWNESLHGHGAYASWWVVGFCLQAFCWGVLYPCYQGYGPMVLFLFFFFLVASLLFISGWCRLYRNFLGVFLFFNFLKKLEESWQYIFCNVWKNSLMKPSGLGFFFMGSLFQFFLIAIRLHRYSRLSFFKLGRLLDSKGVSITSRFSFFVS